LLVSCSLRRCTQIGEDREKAAVLRMEFKAFRHAFILIPVQIVRTSRRLVFRLLAWNPWQAVFLRGFDHGATPLRD
jgi:hypothetical protein